MGTLYKYTCAHCGYEPEEEIGLGVGMRGIEVVLVCCTTCRDFRVQMGEPFQLPLRRCPVAAWHEVSVVDEPGEGETLQLPCPKCKTLNPLMEVGLWD